MSLKNTGLSLVDQLININIILSSLRSHFQISRTLHQLSHTLPLHVYDTSLVQPVHNPISIGQVFRRFDALGKCNSNETATTVTFTEFVDFPYEALEECMLAWKLINAVRMTCSMAYLPVGEAMKDSSALCTEAAEMKFFRGALFIVVALRLT